MRYVHDDASQDKTASIILDYAEKYPSIIKPIIQRDNQFSRGIRINYKYNFPRAHGKYIAMCEADDFWIDDYKLQKQIEILESNPSVNLVYGKAMIKHESGRPYPGYPTTVKKHPSFRELCFNHKVPTSTMVLRKNAILPVPKWAHDFTMGDIFLSLYALRSGKAEYVDIELGCYRKHQASLTNKKSQISIGRGNSVKFFYKLSKEFSLVKKSIIFIYIFRLCAGYIKDFVKVKN